PCTRSIHISSLLHLAAPPELYTLSLHDALPISPRLCPLAGQRPEPAHRAGDHQPAVGEALRHRHRAHHQRLRHAGRSAVPPGARSEEHTSELQSRENLVCRLLLEKKKPAASHTS